MISKYIIVHQDHHDEIHQKIRKDIQPLKEDVNGDTLQVSYWNT